jgi:large subunit ribosomal protein L29
VKYADISGLSETELTKKTTELRKEMFEARMKNSLGQLANPMSIRESRRDVARMKTAAAAKTVQPKRKISRAARAASKAKAVKG